MFDLRISFTGLCLFVPSPDGSELFVVLPKVDAMKMPGGKGMPTHRASVFYSSVYETGVSVPSPSFREVLLSGSINLPGDGVKSKTAPKVSGKTLNLGQVLDVAEAAYGPPRKGRGGNRYVKKDAVKPGFPGVAAIFTIHGGRLLSYSASFPWFLPTQPDRPRPLAWKIDWLIREIDSKTLPFSWLGDATGMTGALIPNEDGVIELRVKNVPLSESTPEDMPYRPPESSPAGNHTRAFYQFLNGGPTSADTPTYGAPKGSKNIYGGLITCTPGQGQLGT